MTDTSTTPRPAINSRHQTPGLLPTPVAARIAGTTEATIKWWSNICVPTIDVAADIGKGGASTRRWSPWDIWKLALVAELLPVIPTPKQAIVEQVWALHQSVLDMFRPRYAWVAFRSAGPGLTLTQPTQDHVPVLIVPLDPVIEAYRQAVTEAAPPEAEAMVAARALVDEYADWKRLRPQTSGPKTNLAETWPLAECCDAPDAGTLADLRRHQAAGEAPCEAARQIGSIKQAVYQYQKRFGPTPNAAS